MVKTRDDRGRIVLTAVQNISLHIDMPTSHLRNKVYKYALFYFPYGRNVGTAPTASICEGYRNKIKENKYVILNWEGSWVWGFILKLHGSLSFILYICTYHRVTLLVIYLLIFKTTLKSNILYDFFCDFILLYVFKKVM